MVSGYWLLALLHMIPVGVVLTGWRRRNARLSFVAGIYLPSYPVAIVLHLLIFKHTPMVVFSVPMLAFVGATIVWDLRHRSQGS